MKLYITLGLLVSISTMAMDTEKTAKIEPNTSDETADAVIEVVKKRKREILFNLVATITVGNTNRWLNMPGSDHPDTLEFPSDYIIETRNNKAPYKDGNGGLLNPKLIHYEIKHEATTVENTPEFKYEMHQKL